MSDGSQKLIGNIALRDALGWDKGKYQQAKDQLIAANKVVKGTGMGGSIGLAQAPGAKTKALQVFISYSHVDENLKIALLKHLEPLHQTNLIETWHDRKIKAGDEWEDKISTSLKSSDIVILLVSIDFIISEYCYGIELESAIELHNEDKLRIIPVILRNCLWDHTPFAKFQALPKDAKAITSWPDQDEALAAVAFGIKQIASEILESR
tara:strand:- start:196 stop:822 length:627 start_codon:yes stop_codon:yes gene_type:complete